MASPYHPCAAGPCLPRRAATAGEKGGAVAGRIALTAPEIRRLLEALLWRERAPPDAVIAWSDWRRRHQARARVCHYRARGAGPP
ncbi:hypothetical protein EBL84_00495 [Marichromatium sp. AB31]|nr:hypothetical protein [Marichromatium gracile]RNE91938.1 hypothetical protein EBL84_00495 [Marichromatium sp. AB31]